MVYANEPQVGSGAVSMLSAAWLICQQALLDSSAPTLTTTCPSLLLALGFHPRPCEGVATYAMCPAYRARRGNVIITMPRLPACIRLYA